MTKSKAQSVYVFGPGVAEGDVSMKALLGGKGANLSEMCRIGLNVPPGFTITTESCAGFHAGGGQNLSEDVWEDVLAAIHRIEDIMGKNFADPEDPLLLSVRSGAAISMPGMMDTVLNLGLNDTVVHGLAAKAGERFAYDSYRRLLDMYGNVVLGFAHEEFESVLAALKEEQGVTNDSELSAGALKTLVERYKGVYKAHAQPFPSDPLVQLRSSICAVFESWEGDRAVAYRHVNKITGLAGTAVNIQAMVYGNLGDSSGTGVLFTRNPSTGEAKLYGEYLINAQGEDVVAGVRTPQPIALLEKELPEAYAVLQENCDTLEREYQDVMDIEFTVQEGKLYMLQCRTGKRTGAAAMQFICDFVDSGMTTVARALSVMVEPTHLDQLLHPYFKTQKKEGNYGAGLRVLGKGLAASPGAGVGRIVFDSTTAERLAEDGKHVILVRHETSAEDVKGMYCAEGVLTQQGGMTSHAAVVARGWGKPCVAGCADLVFSVSASGSKTVSLGGFMLKEGDMLSLNGATGEIIAGAAEVAVPQLSGDALRVLSWADEHRHIKVMANADTVEDAIMARKNGADGIGLTRTEHMFFKTAERIDAVRSMIMHDVDASTSSLEDVLQPVEDFQREDFEGIFRAMDGLPVTIRLLDPPLHEFLPALDNSAAIHDLAYRVGISADDVVQKISAMHEVNPMLGFRGCRLGIAHPNVTRVQVRAIISAAIEAQRTGVAVKPHIMVPLVATTQEFENQLHLIRTTATATMESYGTAVVYQVGTMIETPRAALIAADIAKHAEFFSFGTNDLTQMTYGLSRDDVGKFMSLYLNEKIFTADPFQVLDVEGVGQLLKMAVHHGRTANPNLTVGICGEQGGEPSSITFCSTQGLDYVSCSAPRVPVARLAAAQAAIRPRCVGVGKRLIPAPDA